MKKSDNPFLNQDLQTIAHAARDAWQEEHERKLVQARKILADSGIKVGDYVKISWKVDGRHGGQTLSHQGKLTELTDRWIRIEESDRAPGYLAMGLAAITHASNEIEKLSEAPAENPFMVAAQATDNPFLGGAA